MPTRKNFYENQQRRRETALNQVQARIKRKGVSPDDSNENPKTERAKMNLEAARQEEKILKTKLRIK